MSKSSININKTDKEGEIKKGGGIESKAEDGITLGDLIDEDYKVTISDQEPTNNSTEGKEVKGSSIKEDSTPLKQEKFRHRYKNDAKPNIKTKPKNNVKPSFETNRNDIKLNPKPIIEYKDVTIKTKKKYKQFNINKQKYEKQNKPILENINLKINEGDFVVIVGDNGVGKTTLLKSIIYDIDGLILEGGVTYKGLEVGKKAVQEIRQDIGNVFQEYALIDTKTVRENIMYPLRVLGREGKTIKGKEGKEVRNTEWAFIISKYLGIEDKLEYYPHQLSGGQIQRVKIARSMALNPEVYLVDEPTSNLDKTISRGIMKIFEDLNREGKTIVMVTHHKELLTKENKTVIRITPKGLEVEDSNTEMRENKEGDEDA